MNSGIEHDRILVIAAHPDDIDFTIAGSVALCARAGKTVGYCIATSGDKGFDEDLPVEERMRIREEEQRAAAAVVGVEEVHFLRKPDGELRNTPGLRRAIVAVIRKFKPDAVVVTGDPGSTEFESFYGSHPDHRALSEAAYDSVYPAVGNRFYFPDLLELGLDPHKIKEVLFSGSSKPDYFMDIGETFDLKIKALRCHKSQVSGMDNLEDRMRDWGRTIGEPEGMAIAESFRRMEHPDGSGK